MIPRRQISFSVAFIALNVLSMVVSKGETIVIDDFTVGDVGAGEQVWSGGGSDKGTLSDLRDRLAAGPNDDGVMLDIVLVISRMSDQEILSFATNAVKSNDVQELRILSIISTYYFPFKVAPTEIEKQRIQLLRQRLKLLVSQNFERLTLPLYNALNSSDEELQGRAYFLLTTYYFATNPRLIDHGKWIQRYEPMLRNDLAKDDDSGRRLFAWRVLAPLHRDEPDYGDMIPDLLSDTPRVFSAIIHTKQQAEIVCEGINRSKKWAVIAAEPLRDRLESHLKQQRPDVAVRSGHLREVKTIAYVLARADATAKPSLPILRKWLDLRISRELKESLESAIATIDQA